MAKEHSKRLEFTCQGTTGAEIEATARATIVEFAGDVFDWHFTYVARSWLQDKDGAKYWVVDVVAFQDDPDDPT